MRTAKEQAAAEKAWQSTPVHLTPEGLKRLREKLARLKEKLPGLISETQRTRGYGDTSDNAEYKDAKMASRRAQRQVLYIEDQLKKVEVIKAGPSAAGKVQLGSTVVLETKDGIKKTFEIVGSYETAPQAGRISHVSPLGAALLGHAASEMVQVETPRGPQEYRILEIS